MSEEERQRQMDFIVNRQSHFAADVERLREERRAEMEEQRERWRKADESWAETAEGIRALLAIAGIHEREIMENSKQLVENSKQLAEMREAAREADERLSALINAVERIISERRNGGRGRTDGRPRRGRGDD